MKYEIIDCIDAGTEFCPCHIKIPQKEGLKPSFYGLDLKFISNLPFFPS